MPSLTHSSSIQLMDGQTVGGGEDGWIDGIQIGGWMDRQQVEGWMVGQTVGGQMDVWIDGIQRDDRWIDDIRIYKMIDDIQDG